MRFKDDNDNRYRVNFTRATEAHIDKMTVAEFIEYLENNAEFEDESTPIYIDGKPCSSSIKSSRRFLAFSNCVYQPPPPYAIALSLIFCSNSSISLLHFAISFCISSCMRCLCNFLVLESLYRHEMLHKLC